MPLYVMLTRVTPDETSPEEMERLELRVNEKIKSECPQTEWLYNLAVLGPFDYLDIFEAPDSNSAFKVSTIVRSFGHAHTEVWPAVEWKFFKGILKGLSRNEKIRITFGEGIGEKEIE